MSSPMNKYTNEWMYIEMTEYTNDQKIKGKNEQKNKNKLRSIWMNEPIYDNINESTS